jgi:hypothetical protein
MARLLGGTPAQTILKHLRCNGLLLSEVGFRQVELQHVDGKAGGWHSCSNHPQTSQMQF